MPWEQRSVRVLTICWLEFSYPCGIKWCKKWGIPYPCGVKTCKGNLPYPCIKYVTKVCCTGVHKVRCYGVYGEHWHCCDGRESKWWGKCWGVGSTIADDVTVCRGSAPSESKGCPNAVGIAPPWAPISIGVGVGLVAGSLAAAVTDAQIQQGLIGGAIIGAAFGAGTGHRWGFPLTLVAVAIVVALCRLFAAG